jgi:hypothetical protein
VYSNVLLCLAGDVWRVLAVGPLAPSPFTTPQRGRPESVPSHTRDTDISYSGWVSPTCGPEVDHPLLSLLSSCLNRVHVSFQRSWRPDDESMNIEDEDAEVVWRNNGEKL